MASINHDVRAESGASAPTRDERDGFVGYMKRRPALGRGLVIGAVVIIVLVVAGWWYYSGQETTDDAQIDGHVTPISARVGGTVVQVFVNDNQHVEAGAVLVQIDQRDYQVALDRARGDFADAEAAVSGAQAGVPITTTTTASQLRTATAGEGRAEAGVEAAGREVEAARARLAAAQARLREAQATEVRTSRDLERLKQLVAKDEISQQQYDAAAAAAEGARAATEGARAAVAEAMQTISVAQSHQTQAVQAQQQARAEVQAARTAPQQVTVTRARASSAQAKLQQAQAAVRQAELNFAYTTITAPISGTVSRKTVEIGQVVQPGQPLLAIVPLKDVWVTANFKETQLEKMRIGQRASIHVDAYDQDFSGQVDSFSAATGARFSLLPPENATGNFVKVVQRVPIKILFDKAQDAQRPLRPGMSVVATVYTR